MHCIYLDLFEAAAVSLEVPLPRKSPQIIIPKVMKHAGPQTTGTKKKERSLQKVHSRGVGSRSGFMELSQWSPEMAATAYAIPLVHMASCRLTKKNHMALGPSFRYGKAKATAKSTSPP